MPLKLPDLFRTLSNQTRLEILTMLMDNYLTATEIATLLQIDLSTVYRHLQQMKKLGILTSTHLHGVERFDFSSPHIFRMLDEAITFMGELKGFSPIVCSEGICSYYLGGELDEIEPDQLLDMRGESCPVPDIQARKTLRKMNPGEILLVIVDYPLSGERIPASVQKEGHEFLKKVADNYGDIKIYIRRRENG
jgi:TusA-related sulfurtransferase/DNA-binding transcriptional ArsR family regulator